MRRFLVVVVVACAPQTTPVAVPVAGAIDPHAPLTMPAKAADDWDADRDGIVDIDDLCPDEPEDVDGFEDGDGCPEPDNDGDGIKDRDDKCPNEPETYNGKDDEDGCPDRGLVIIH